MSESINGTGTAFATLFTDLQSYANAEAEINQEQWNFVHRCSTNVREKFDTLQTQAEDSLRVVEENRALISRLPADLGANIEELERHLANMEAVVKDLDEYSIALERRYLAPS
eukprot:GILI01017390.1.p1 GENE.GILI01017390.1~~GILI01017390.1.p1  ORF type:complete len:120 (-),score=4.07 GILI01017390.1:81-419(-)